MSSRFHEISRTVAVAAMSALCALFLGSAAFAQSDDGDPEARVQQLESQLRTLTGQNEELQYRNRQLEDQLKALQGNPGVPNPGASRAQAAPMNAPMAQPNYAGVPPAQVNPNPAYRQPSSNQPGYAQPGYGQPVAGAPAPIVQDPQGVSQGRRRGDAFDPSQSPNAPGAPQALGGGQLPIDPNAPIGAPGGRGAGEPLDLGNNNANPGDGLTTAPPSASPKDEFDLGLGYMQRRDYALAEQTMRNFAQKYPTSPLVADSQYWLGESFFQRQLYRDSAEAFLGVTTKFDKSGKAPDALLRLGQSLAALKEKEAACAAFGEVARKYPRASGSVKQAVDREQKRVKC